MAWQWTYDGSLESVGAGSADFPSQADAEAWIGEHWRDLFVSGVTAVTLIEDGRFVYGPMSLESA